MYTSVDGVGPHCLGIRAVDLLLRLCPWPTLTGGSYLSDGLIQAWEILNQVKIA